MEDDSLNDSVFDIQVQLGWQELAGNANLFLTFLRDGL